MKKTVSIMLALLLVCLMLPFSCASAQNSDAEIAEHSVAAIRQRGTLRVAYQAQNSWATYRVPQGISKYANRVGEPAGFVPLLCQQLAEDLGVELEFVFYDEFWKMNDAVEYGAVDISACNWTINDEDVAGTGDTMTDNIRPQLQSSSSFDVFLRADPQTPSRPVIASEEELAAARIAATQGYSRYVSEQYPQAEVVTYATNEAALEALADGEADAGVFGAHDQAFDDLLAEAVRAGKICRSNYKITYTSHGTGFVLMNGNTDLRDYINRRLAEYRSSGLLKRLYDQGDREGREMGITASVSAARPVDTYAVNVAEAVGGSPFVSQAKAAAGDVIVMSTYLDEGYTMGSVSVTDSSGKEIAYEDTGDGWYVYYAFTMPAGEVNIQFTYQEMTNPFTDVAEGDYFYDAVLWAVEEGIVNGTTPTTFSPGKTCNQAEIITMIHRSLDTPDGGGDNPYSNAKIASGNYYYEAMLWAAGQGVVSDMALDPDAPCTRADVVTYMWRAAGSPAASGNSFDDVAADAPYAQAVAWAVANGIANGTGNGKFSPEDTVTRGQAVTFLLRGANVEG